MHTDKHTHTSTQYNKCVIYIKSISAKKNAFQHPSKSKVLKDAAVNYIQRKIPLWLPIFISQFLGKLLYQNMFLQHSQWSFPWKKISFMNVNQSADY